MRALEHASVSRQSQNTENKALRKPPKKRRDASELQEKAKNKRLGLHRFLAPLARRLGIDREHFDTTAAEDMNSKQTILTTQVQRAAPLACARPRKVPLQPMRSCSSKLRMWPRLPQHDAGCCTVEFATWLYRKVGLCVQLAGLKPRQGLVFARSF